MMITNRQPAGVSVERSRGSHPQPPPGNCAYHMIQMSVGSKEGSNHRNEGTYPPSAAEMVEPRLNSMPTA